jgi:hypothetical protein
MFFRRPSVSRSRRPLRKQRESGARQRRIFVEQLEDRNLLTGAAFLWSPDGANGLKFGDHIVPLPNGNVVVTASNAHVNGQYNGAVYLFDGDTGEVISTLRGHDSDYVGSGGIVPLANGNFLILSPGYGGSGSLPSLGAVTWASGETGINGFIDETNSLIGSQADDHIGADLFFNSTVFGLPNGNYVVLSADFPGGAITLGNGSTGTTGVVSAENSLIGMNGYLDKDAIEILANGNAVVLGNDSAIFIDADGELRGTADSSNSLSGFPNPAPGEAPLLRDIVEVGDSNYVVVTESSVTWADGDTGISGLVNSENSLLTFGRSITGVTALENGDYVVVAPSEPIGELWLDQWAKGTVTWADGNVGIVGQVNSTNSLVGAQRGSYLGSGGIEPLENGGYVIISPDVDTTTVLNVGAVTWAPAGGLRGVISPTNSLFGVQLNDRVGSGGVVELTNGNYVISSPQWDSGNVTDVGAVTWARGNQAKTGVVSALNSLVGSTANDQIGTTSVTALTNGNYLVASESWDNDSTVNAGAVTWGNGATGTNGVVAAANSLVGSTAEDRIGTSITQLTNGNYVVLSPHWSNTGAPDAGALTWQRGNLATGSVVSAANSFVGTHTGDFSRSFENQQPAVVPLTNGNYVFSQPGWDSGSLVDVGAVTWARGTSAMTGTVSALSSLFGTSAYDGVGAQVIALTNGNYAVYSEFDVNQGAVTWGSGTTGVKGPIGVANSVLGNWNGDQIGNRGLVPLPNGNYLFASSEEDNGVLNRASSASWADGTTPQSGHVENMTPTHMISTTANGKFGSFVLDDNRRQFFAPFAGEGVIRIGDYDTGFRVPKAQMNLRIPTDIATPAGLIISVPVRIESVAGLGTQRLTSAQLMVYFDPAVLEMITITRGNLFNNKPGWSVSSEINAVAGYAAITVTGTQPIEGDVYGNLVVLNVQVKPEVGSGSTTLNLADGRKAAHVTQLNSGSVQIFPQPTAAANDAGVDGLITIYEGPDSLPPDAPAASQQGNNLLVTGTTHDDFIYIFALDANRIRVRVNHRQFTEFVGPVQITVNGRRGDNFVYIDPVLRDPPPIILSGGEATEPDEPDSDPMELALLDWLKERDESGE